MPTQLWTYEEDDETSGTAEDDFIVGLSLYGTASETLSGGDGNDYILGDGSNSLLTGTSNSFDNPENIDYAQVWTGDQNPFVERNYTAHTTLYIRADAGQRHYSSVTVGSGETITIDVDFGYHVVGYPTDVIVDLFDSSGTLVATNNYSELNVDAGSSIWLDPFLSFHNLGGADTFTIQFRENADPGGPLDEVGLFEGGETFLANISVTGHANTEITEMGADRLSGGRGDDTIAGQGGDDILDGDEDSDTLFGGSGNDLLNGGAGVDVMAGEFGDDIYLVDDGGDVIVEAAFYGHDQVRSSVSYALGDHLEDLTLIGEDALEGIGNNAANVITGNAAANALLGLGGNDVLIGRAGRDRMYGGTGDDTYVVDSSLDQVSESNGAGIDLVRASVSQTLSANVENLTLAGAASINGAGNDLDNLIIGNSAANTLDGRSGADTLRGGNGNDTYIVDNAADRAVERSATGGTDTLRSSVSNALGGNIENMLLLGSAAINGSGNALDNDLTGNGAANRLAGNDGLDSLFGLGGNDFLNGGLGNDRLRGGTGSDSFVFNTALHASRNVDRLTDFAAVDDRLVLDQTIFGGLGTGTLTASAFRAGAAAADADDRIIYDSASGNIYYDADGNGAGAQLLFARVNVMTPMTNTDFFIVS